ncbi:MAG: TIGR00730 family Rossman fold protein [Gammaproteobacteria bacterium]|nr:TIGR00730 family Rossman fold protein [Gammaproteobacteria bacterium]
MKSVAIFCGAAMGTDPGLQKEIIRLVQLLAENKIELIYGGGKVGIMGLVADTAIQHRCKVIGVIPDFLIDKELAHESLSKLITAKSFSERKAIIYNKADAFILLPGGIGSLDEFFDGLSQMHVGVLSKKFGILNTRNYYDATLAQLHKAKEMAFMSTEMYDAIKVGTTAKDLLANMMAEETVQINRWSHRSKETI